MEVFAWEHIHHSACWSQWWSLCLLRLCGMSRLSIYSLWCEDEQCQCCSANMHWLTRYSAMVNCMIDQCLFYYHLHSLVHASTNHFVFSFLIKRQHMDIWYCYIEVNCPAVHNQAFSHFAAHRHWQSTVSSYIISDRATLVKIGLLFHLHIVVLGPSNTYNRRAAATQDLSIDQSTNQK